MLLQEMLIKQGESTSNVIKQHKPEEALSSTKLVFYPDVFSGCKDNKEETCLFLRFFDHQLQRKNNNFLWLITAEGSFFTLPQVLT